MVALHLYTKAMALGYQAGCRNWGQAVPLFREALAEDPTFASAHVFLAWAIANSTSSSRFPTESLPHLKRAMDLAETASRPERMFILGTDYWARRDDELACTTFKNLADLFPAHYWGVDSFSKTIRRSCTKSAAK